MAAVGFGRLASSCMYANDVSGTSIEIIPRQILYNGGLFPDYNFIHTLDRISDGDVVNWGMVWGKGGQGVEIVVGQRVS